MDPFGWRSSEIYLKSEMPTRYDQVVNAFNELLASYGYVHENGLYRVEKESRETLAFFCHLGVTCVLLSALWKTSPFFLWQRHRAVHRGKGTWRSTLPRQADR